MQEPVGLLVLKMGISKGYLPVFSRFQKYEEETLAPTHVV